VTVWSSSSGDCARRESGSRSRRPRTSPGGGSARSTSRLTGSRPYASSARFATPRLTWLLNLYFVNDTTHSNEKLATSQQQWENEWPGAERDLGLEGKHVPHSGRAYAEAGTYDELLAGTGG
jgi:hypothetical protein